MQDKSSANTLKDTILEKIESDQVKMRPKLFYVLKVGLVAAVGVAILVVVSLLTSFILFSIWVSDRAFLLGFGARGINTFLMLFPWRLFILAFVLVVIFTVLIRSFRFGYRSPILYFSIIALGLSIGSGFLIARTPLHQGLSERDRVHHLPVLHGIYHHVSRPAPSNDVFRGFVRTIMEQSIRVEDEEQRIVTVVLPANWSNRIVIKVGDQLFIAGDWHGATFRAYGLKKIK